MPNKYYVYVYLDPRKTGIYIYGDLHFNFEPFYVGRGSADRKYMHLRKYNLKTNKLNVYKNNKIKKLISLGFNLKDYIIIIYDQLSYNDSITLETDTITKIGRLDKKTGPLTNLTNGGEGTNGIQSRSKGKTYEEIYGVEKAQKLKEIRRNNCVLNTPERIQKAIKRSKGKTFEERFGIKKAQEMKIKIANARKNQPGNNKGKTLPTKGKTYEEIYGFEVAAKLKENRRQRKGKRYMKEGLGYQ